jgi:DNA-binding MarR family transcriptional regulator
MPIRGRAQKAGPQAASIQAASMKNARSISPGSFKKTRKRQTLHAPGKNYPLQCQLLEDIVSINDNLVEMRHGWAKLFDVSGPQWNILMVINELDRGEGVSVGDVSARINAASTFVTTQTKLLEKQGLLARVSSAIDARVVLMSLSDRAYQEISQLFGRWGELHDLIFSDFDAPALRALKEKLGFLRRRSETACRHVGDEL